MADSLVRHLATFAVDVHSSGPPAEVAAKIAEHVLDTIGVAVAGAGEPAPSAARRMAAASGGTPEATVLVSGERLPAPAVGLVNGTMAHALDFDDTHLPSVLHPSASVVPAALAAAETADSSGAELIGAVAVGNEIACRLGMAAYDPELGNSVFFEHGFHATSICGTLGSAAAAGLLLGATTDQLAHGIAIAASMGGGLLEANRTGGSVKPLHCGFAAQAGIVAARLALEGVTGPATVFEGRFGFFRAFTGGRSDLRVLTDALDERWETSRLFVKPYPTNHFTHAGIDAARALLATGVDPVEITAIELGVAAPVLRTIAQPPEMKARPESGHHAKFSGPFTVATAFLTESGLGVSNADFTDAAVTDPERIRLAGLVRCVPDEVATRAFPHQFLCVLRVTLADGSVHEHRVEHTRGGPERPLAPEELAHKFRLNVEPVLGAERCSHALALITGLGALEGVRLLIAALAG